MIRWRFLVGACGVLGADAAHAQAGPFTPIWESPVGPGYLSQTLAVRTESGPYICGIDPESDLEIARLEELSRLKRCRDARGMVTIIRRAPVDLDTEHGVKLPPDFDRRFPPPGRGGAASSMVQQWPQQLPESAYLYSPSAQRRKANVSAMARSLNNPKAGAELIRFVDSSNLFVGVERSMRGVGLNINNLADVYTMWWITLWMASRGRAEANTAQQCAAVKAQVKAMFVGATAFTRMTNVTKQELADHLIVQAVLIDASLMSAKGNPAQTRQVGVGARKMAASLGQNLDGVELTANGFVPARR